MKNKRIAPEIIVGTFFVSVIFFLLGLQWLRGLSTFWSDLTYLHQSWRAGPAMMIMAGRTPLWEPSLYFGMPMAASMQGGLFYPPTILFYLFGFSTATACFQALHLLLAGFLCALWLRTWRLSWGASLGGALVFAFSGVMIARLPYLNHLATLTWTPALGLFFRRPAQLAAILALMIFAGYPTFIPGCACAVWAVAVAARTQRTCWRAAAMNWALAGLLAAAVAAVQLLPGLELAVFSRRAAGVGLVEALTWGFQTIDFLQWLGPLAVGWSRFHPADDWYKTVYLGVFGACAAGYGAAALPRKRALILVAALSAVFLLTLGGSNPVSSELWGKLSFLRFVRYPGNLSYIALPLFAVLAGAGISRGRAGSALVLALAVELIFIGRSATPLAPKSLFTEAGVLARTLQETLGSTRYLISPRALQASTGSGVFDWKQRLYGLTNAPYRIRAATNFGEPLVPAASYAVMDALFTLPGADAAAGWMPWIGASRLLTPEKVDSARLSSEGRSLWEVSRVRGQVSLAYRLSPEQGASFPEEWPPAPPPLGAPLELRWPREDRFEVSGFGEGWVFVSEPRFPGWTIALSSGEKELRVTSRPALEAFQKVATPAGPWTIRWRYEPLPWRVGLIVTWASLLALGASWYHRVVATTS
ncbi:MAG: hypothetical protein AAB036_03120 [Elusimicrobiota bacterium]